MTASPVGPSGVSGPVDGRSVAEIRADLELLADAGFGRRELRDEADRLLADVPALLAEVEAAHRFEVSAAAESAGLANRLNGVAAERDELRGVVQAQQVRLAAVEALLPWSDEEFPIFPYQLREALGAEESDFLLIPRAALAAAADAPQPEPATKETQR